MVTGSLSSGLSGLWVAQVNGAEEGTPVHVQLGEERETWGGRVW